MKRYMTAAVAILITVSLVKCSITEKPTQKKLPEIQYVVDTASGKVGGFRTENGVAAFLGIPYAKPPKGDLRFAPPVEIEPWQDVRPANALGPACPQPADKIESAAANAQDEDCLALNIWTPNADANRRPVIVFIHGGGFISGSSRDSAYDGSSLSKRGDIVFASANYRIAALGFLYLGDFGPQYKSSGNNGIQDQLMALRWIKKNISKFGGDPENITIMGESAGSISVTTLMGLPQSKGLFSKAIAESGTCYKYLRTLEDASRRTSRFLECAHVKRDQKPEDVVASLRKLSSKDIVRATAKQLADNMLEACVVFAPVLDGDFVPEDPAEAIRKGSAAGVALLHGTNEDEYRYWLCYFSALRNIPLKDLFKFLPSSLREKLDAHKAEILDFYGKKYPGPNKGDGTLAFVTDVMFRIPHIRVSDAQAQDPKNRVWLYRFNWKSHVKDYLGACHAIEIPFVFRTFSSPLSEEIVGPNPPMELSDIMQDAWINFARTGNPNHPGMPEWPAYDPNRRATMILDTKCETKDDPDRDVREFYTNQVPW